MLHLLTARRRRQAGEWLVELLIVVFGVLIALYAQQWASDRQSRKAAVEAEARIREEIYGNAMNDAERIALHQCIQRRLGQIAERIGAGANDWKSFAYDYSDNGLFLVRRIYRTPSRSWIDDSYRGALGGGALDSVSAERKALWSQLYRAFAKAQDINDHENALSAELNSLWIDGNLRPEDRRAMVRVVAQLDRANGLITLINRQNLAVLSELNYRLTDTERDGLQKLLNSKTPDNSNNSLAMKRRIYGDCVDAEAFKLLDPALKIS